MKGFEKESFVMNLRYREQLRMLSSSDCGRLLWAIYDHEAGEEPNLRGMSPPALMLFSVICQQLDYNREEYRERCRQNMENGKKGGRPRKKQGDPLSEPTEKTKKTERFSKKPKKPDYEYECGNGYDSEYEFDSVFGLGEECACAQEEVAPLSRHRLGEQERVELLEKGIDEAYIDSRLSRAEEHAAASGQPIGEVLIAWWSSDRHTPPWNGDAKPRAGSGKRGRADPPCDTRAVGELGRSFDADDFFNAALNRSLREMGIDPETGDDLAPAPS